jgi:hypothetical protein
MKTLFLLIFIQLHGPGGQVIDIAPDEITSLREPQANSESHFGKGVHCIIKMTNGAINAVVEHCEAIRQEIERMGK